MTKFKVGDRVKYTGKSEEYHDEDDIGAIGTVIEYSPDSVKVKWDKGSEHAGSGGKFDANLELITPTGFEVGKKYVLISTQHRVEVLHSHEEEHWLKNEKGKTFTVHDRDFIYYEEYIPPPPEEWRIVYKDRFGNVTVGKVPFKSESEANSSQFWTDHSTAFKTIRVDA